MIIDAHVHVSQAAMQDHFKICDKLGIDRMCLLGRFDLVLKYQREAPDRVIPVAQIQMDECEPARIDRLVELGMKGLKVNGPMRPYNDERYHPFYQKAEHYDLPIVFHTGISNRSAKPKPCVNMRPEHLDDIGRRFVRLKMVMAHLGNPWYEVGAETCKWNRNIVCDLSGSTLKKKSPAYLRDLFWWDKPGHHYRADGDKHPFEKIIFGSDTGPEWVEDSYRDYLRLLDDWEVPEAYRRKIMGETAAELFGVG